MSNQGWSRPPRADRTVGEKVFDVVTWPVRKLAWGVAVVVLTVAGRRRR
ncbi:MAG: hypothetical protein JNK64_21455 [Myxococcales bacterium]|nr:hypothetical protein [Myxococcales bacterium]